MGTPRARVWLWPAIGAERPVVVAHRGGEAGGDRLLADPEVRRPAHEPGEEQLVGALLEQPALEHRPVHAQPQVAVEILRRGAEALRVTGSAFSTGSPRTAPATGSG